MGKWWSLAALGVTMLHTGCGERQTPAPTREAPVNTAAQATGIAGTNPSAALVIIGIYPPSAKAGDGFNKQKDGSSALGIKCENAMRSTAILLDGV